MDRIEPAVAGLGTETHMQVGTTAAELTQCLRRLARAIASERVTQAMKAGKPVAATPLIQELEKQYTQLTNVQRAYGLKDEEMGEQ